MFLKPDITKTAVLASCRNAVLFLAACSLAAPDARAWTLSPRGVLAIDTTAVPSATELSGLVHRGPLGGSSHEFIAVQDSGAQLVMLSVALSDTGAPSLAAATSARSLALDRDFEGIALGPNGTALLAEETSPAIRRFDLATGTHQSALAMHPVFSNDRANFAFESLTRAPNSDFYWTANEEALTPDGPISNTSHGTTVRLQKFELTSSLALSLHEQYAYHVDPIHVGTSTDSRTRSGLSDLVALPDGSLLALERSLGITGVIFGIPLYQYESRIYHVTFDHATNIALPPLDAGLNGLTFSPASKMLLWSGQAGGGLGQNLEGLALGPLLPNGDWSVLGIVDNGGGTDPLSGNTIVAFSLAPGLSGDYNFDGAVDSADYVVWRKGLGGVYRPEHYDFWRSNFAAIAAGSTARSALVPEPATSRLLLIAACAAGILAGRRSKSPKLACTYN